jgi:hypothetical protein
MTPRAAKMPRAAIIAGAMVVAGLGIALIPGPAAAQFLGGLFGGGDAPPRPPSGVPGRSDAPPAYQGQPQYQAQPQYQQPPAAQAQSAPQAAPPYSQTTTLAPMPGRVQSEDLPPPPGAAAVAPAPASPALPRPATAAVPGQPGAAPGQPPGAPGQRRPDEMTQPPAAKIVNPKAMFSGLDKITGRITSFDAAIGETVQFGALQVTPRACYTRPPTETPLTDGFVEVDEVTLQGEVRRIFTGWMFAASPGLHAVEHPIYDVWLTDCKGGAQTVAEVPPPAVAAPPPTTPAARTTPQPAVPRPPASATAPAPQRAAQPPRQPSSRPPADAVLAPPLMR